MSSLTLEFGYLLTRAPHFREQSQFLSEPVEIVEKGSISEKNNVKMIKNVQYSRTICRLKEY